VDAAFHDGEEVRFRTMDNLVGDSAALGLASWLLGDQELLLVSAEEPPTFAQAERDANWRAAMLEDMKAIEENETWELIDPPLDAIRSAKSGWIRSSGMSVVPLSSIRHALLSEALSSTRASTSRKSFHE